MKLLYKHETDQDENPSVFFRYFIFSILAVSFIAISGCNKKKVVRDADNNLVTGVKVIIYGEGTPPRVSNIADTAVSNSAGEAMFNLNYMRKAGQAGVAVLNISANKNIPGSSPLAGSDIIKVVEQTTNSETVFVQN
ncbi:MAG: hypothetical protein QNL60_01810 [Flavobacteriales bacterium]